MSLNPDLSPADVTRIITSGADDVAAPGWDPYTGSGRANALRAVLVAGTQVSDTIAPTVKITSPTGGSNASGSVVLIASASDNIGVTAVDFYLDGVYLGTASNQYSMNWDTHSAANGAHSLVARAVDMAGNVGSSAPINIKVSNSAVSKQTFSGSVNTKAAKTHSWQVTRTSTARASLSWTGTARLQLSVYNNQGALVKSSSSATSGLTLDLGPLAAGAYTLEIRANSGKVRYTLKVTTTSL